MYRARHVDQRATLRRRRSRQTLSAGLLAAALIVAAPSVASAQVARGATGAGAVDVNVHKGDTVSAIVQRACGRSSPGLWRGLQLDNPAVTNVHLIYPGQTLRVSCRESAALAGSATKPATQPARINAAAPAAWVTPVVGGYCSSRYGPREGGFHAGSDVAVSTGTPIRAAHAGTVAVVKYEAGGGGHYIVLNHGADIFTAYMHLQHRSPLQVGQPVSAGQRIGAVGETGDATGPHLHFEVHRGLWSKVNSAAFLRAQGVRFQC